MANQELVQKFGRLVEKAFSTRTEHIDLQLDFDDKYQHLFKSEYGAAIQIINSVRDSDTLSELLGLAEGAMARTNLQGGKASEVRGGGVAAGGGQAATRAETALKKRAPTNFWRSTALFSRSTSGSSCEENAIRSCRI